MTESQSRTIVKTVTFRILATFTTMVIVYAFTKRVMLSLGIGATEAAAKFIIYYVHERLWTKINWGLKLN